jgi:hypothetical protein
MSGPQDDPAGSAGSEGAVGSLGSEAVKLLGVLADWAGDHTADADGHLATGSAECLYCPICRTVHAVRQASPEVRTQLTTAASALLQAAAGLLAAVGDAEPQPTRVQHIDLDDIDLEEDTP